MRYVGSDDVSTYLRCGHCKKVHAYDTAELESREKKCDICGAQYRTIIFLPGSVKSIKPWIPPMIMAAFFVAILFLLSYPPLLRNYNYNRIVTTSNALLTSIFIPIIASVFSFLPSLNCFAPSNFRLSRVIPLFFVLVESLVLVFLMNTIIQTRYNSLQVINPDTNESQQYFGSVVGECATGHGRVFDNAGNLIYYGNFSNNLYDGYGEKYEPINAVHNNSAEQVYQCTYKGEFSNGVPSGYGREYRYEAEYVFEKVAEESPYLYYEGDFLNGKYCGQGTLYGVTYKHCGGFFEGIYNGYGNQWYINEDNSRIYRMEGYYSNGKLNGRGTKYFPNGQLLFTGDYKDGSGVSGTFYYEDGNIQYIGGVTDGNCWDGEGVYYWKNGRIRYDGSWERDNREGEGIAYREDGTKKYDGHWTENKRSGYGTEYYSDGVSVCYEGRWSEDYWNGMGSEYYKNGKLSRQGVWKDGRLNGVGKWYWENGTLRYEGDFVEGNRSGHGILYWDNGNIEYDGEWKNDKFSGEGERYWQNGNLYFKGHFENGGITGYGSMYNEDGTLRYEGDLLEGKYHGKGISYWGNGNVRYAGGWVNNKYSGYGKEYNEDGELLHEGTFSEGVCVS